MPKENMLQYVSKRQFQCVMMISSWPFIWFCQLLSINVQFSVKVWDAFLHRSNLTKWHVFNAFATLIQVKSVLLMSGIFDDACYQIFANPHQDVNLWINKSYLIWLKSPISILILFTTDLPNSEREELWRRRRTLHTSRHKVSLHDWDQYQNVDSWFQIDFLECSYDLIEISIKMLT